MISRGFAWRAVVAVALLATTGLAQAQGIKVGVVSFGRLLDGGQKLINGHI